jgi:2-oxoglutarate ferredoxin oxidoreductase subunit delta
LYSGIKTGVNGEVIVRVKNRQEFCKCCNICVLVCPSHVFEEEGKVNEQGYIPPKIAHPEKCPNYGRDMRKGAVCEMCILTCPDQALSWDERMEGEER